MLRFEDIVFGPVRSRRLGASLGVNLLPPEGKLCNFDCIYCECGWNRDGACGGRMPDEAAVRAAMEKRFPVLAAEGTRVDSITFSGNGEPTLNPDFAKIVDTTVEMRDRHLPDAAITVLSNATMLHRPGVLAALKKVDNPVLKIDAPTDAGAATVNRPVPGYHVDGVVRNLEAFGGDFILQTMFLRGGGCDPADPLWLDGWMSIVERLHPREVMVYTIDRETPEKGLQKLSVEEMSELVRPLADKGFNIQIRG